MFSIFSRLMVYGVGFLSTMYFSVRLSQVEFSKFSALQSAGEMLALLFGGGVSLVYTLRTERSRVYPGFGSFVRTLALGGVLVVPVFLLLKYVLWAGQDVGTYLYAVLVLGAGASAAFYLKLSAVKVFDSGRAANIEPAVRMTVMTVLFAVLTAVGHEASAEVASTSALAAVWVSAAALSVYWGKIGKAVDVGDLGLTGRDQVSATVFSVISFFSRKSDLLFLSFLGGVGFLADFKIAFLFAEAPLQFLQAHLNGKVAYLYRASSGRGSLHALKMPLVATCVVTVLVLVPMHVYDSFSGARSLGVGLWLVGCMWVKVVISPVELKLVGTVGMKPVTGLALSATAAKYLLVGIVDLFGGEIFIGYLAAACVEFAIYDAYARKSVGCGLLSFYGLQR